MPKIADKLSYALSTTESVSKQHFKKVFDRLFLTDAVESGYKLDDIDNWRRKTERNLESLCLCDFEYGSTASVFPCPAILSIMPRHGLPKALYLGARTPSVVARIKSCASRMKKEINISISNQPAFPMLPRRITVQSSTIDSLNKFANEIGVNFMPDPISAVLVSYVSSVNELLLASAWRNFTEEPTWHRRDFNTAKAYFSRQFSTDSIRLSEYIHPSQGNQIQHLLVNGQRSAVVERDWGRYMVLALACISVIRYDIVNKLMLIPSTMPLPRILSRALTAASGFAPQEIIDPDHGCLLAYVQIHQDFAHLICSKLSQQLELVTISTQVRGSND